jgi:hypothetical protein
MKRRSCLVVFAVLVVAVGPIAAQTVTISEVRIDQPSTDNDEYFEFAGPAGASLDGLTYLVIGDGAGGSGVIEEVTDLTGQTIPASGFFVAAEATFALGGADLITDLNFENSNNVTHLVVRDFSGSIGTDLDSDDDGVLDSTPWSEVVDCVALVETVGSGDLVYCFDTVGPDGPFVPGHAYDCPGGWQIGPFDPVGGDDTPGATNPCAVVVPTLVINEIDYDQPSTDGAEFVEILNGGSATVNLDPYALQLVNGTGGGALVYQTIDLPAVDLAAGDYYVVCANAATVPNCDLDVTPDTNLIQNGSPDAVALVQGAVILDTVSYEGDTGAPYTEGSGAGLEDGSAVAFAGISRLPDGTDTGVNNVDLSQRCITPGGTNSSATSGCPPPVSATLEIWEIQGSGAASPYDGLVVETQDNVVTAVGPEGFFMQTPDARADADPDTSNGIYVYTGGAPGVAVGDQVDVVGLVDEFFDLTEFTSPPAVTIDSSGNPLPTVVAFGATTPSPDPTAPSCTLQFECWEGMLISVAGGTVTGPKSRCRPAAGR